MNQLCTVQGLVLRERKSLSLQLSDVERMGRVGRIATVDPFIKHLFFARDVRTSLHYCMVKAVEARSSSKTSKYEGT